MTAFTVGTHIDAQGRAWYQDAFGIYVPCKQWNEAVDVSAQATDGALLDGNIALDGTEVTVDGVALVANMLAVLTLQTNPVENGIYIVSLTGAWKRHGAFSVGCQIFGSVIYIELGTAGAGTSVTPSSINPVVDTDPILFGTAASGGGLCDAPFATKELTTYDNIAGGNYVNTPSAAVGNTARRVGLVAAMSRQGNEDPVISIDGITVAAGTRNAPGGSFNTGGGITVNLTWGWKEINPLAATWTANITAGASNMVTYMWTIGCNSGDPIDENSFGSNWGTPAGMCEGTAVFTFRGGSVITIASGHDFDPAWMIIDQQTSDGTVSSGVASGVSTGVGGKAHRNTGVAGFASYIAFR